MRVASIREVSPGDAGQQVKNPGPLPPVIAGGPGSRWVAWTREVSTRATESRCESVTRLRSVFGHGGCGVVLIARCKAIGQQFAM
jgi:hypothetical protein